MDSRATTTPPPVGRRERNKQRVRERLYMAAVELFVEKGYDQTSIDEIAERADVARGTFFNYFQRKEDIIGAWGERRRAALVTGLEESGAFTPGSIARLQQCMAVLVRINQEEPRLTTAMLTAWVKAGRPILEEPYVAEVFAEIVDSGMGRGELNPGMSPIGVGNVLRDVYLGALYRWASRPSDTTGTLAEELQQILQLLLDGMTAPKTP
ncbi:TetR/AcrR family transcriptional regulator [Streptomyces luteogriseus]|uniref:TetR/AcrR family transcriptional regulator n=1 Tax=Streptomyces luteogriseus TaxID=68233 RepID=UPI002616380C|nr:TetR/AcrR family transcriptional regulator [Streptomyces luteogriseus]WTJ31783.1 TetR/AcrR family transcriptional regulator [Streptomyces luteogriseus]